MNANKSPFGELITKEELKTRLNVPSTKLIDELMRARKIPFVRLGHRTLRFDWQKVQTALSLLEVKALGN